MIIYMSHTTKFVLILAVICLGLGIGLVGLAQESSITEEVNLDENVQAEDLGIKESKLLPDSRLYFLKEWGREIRSFFTINPVEKIKLRERFTNERLIELKKLIEENKSSEIIKKAAERYQEELEKMKNASEKIKEKAQNNPEIDKFLDKFIKHQILHEKILQKLEKQVPPEVYQKIKEAREKHLERFGEIMKKLEDRQDKIKENLEKNLEEIKGSDFKNFKNLEILKELEEKSPEEIKEAIKKVQEEILNKLQDELEKMTTLKQEKFKEYLDKISGNKEKQLEILENLKFELKQNQENLKEKINEAKDKILEKVQEINCPAIEKPALGFCKDGRIIIKKDDKGCVAEFKCVIPAEIEIRPTPTACITLWNPVCGKDGKTYSNSCFAKLAGVEIDYQGECSE